MILIGYFSYSHWPNPHKLARLEPITRMGQPDNQMCCNGRVTSPPKEKAIPNPLGEWARIAAAQVGSVILTTAREDADNRRSYFFTDALQILATDKMNEIPGIFESAEMALEAGHHVAGFVSYEAGYHFELAAMRLAQNLAGCGGPLVWLGIRITTRSSAVFSHAVPSRERRRSGL
jgi:hypothetical protein